MSQKFEVTRQLIDVIFFVRAKPRCYFDGRPWGVQPVPQPNTALRGPSNPKHPPNLAGPA